MKRATASDIVGAKIHVISIHALVKRATTDCFSSAQEIAISIHALVKRATKAIKENGWKGVFQSTPS